MNTIETSEQIKLSRRCLFGAIAISVAAAELAGVSSSFAQSGKTNAKHLLAITPGMNASFGPLKQIDPGLLNVGYAEANPADGPPVVLLHGWPYDIRSYLDVAPIPRSAG
jgi:hypothetical protein